MGLQVKARLQFPGLGSAEAQPCLLRLARSMGVCQEHDEQRHSPVTQMPFCVLLVEDDPAEVSEIEGRLHSFDADWRVQSVSTLAAARDALGQQRFDLVLLDHSLPDGAGLRLLHATLDTPVVFLAVSRGEELALQALRSGAADYLLKDDHRNYLSLLPFVARSAVRRHRDQMSLRETKEACRRMEAQLRRARQLETLGTLAGGVAHEFNNIMASILGNAELARAETSDRPSLEDYLEEIVRASQRAHTLVQQLLAFTRSDQGSRRPLALGPILEDTVRTLRAGLPASVSIHLDLESASTLVLADAAQIRQALTSLVDNSALAVCGRGRIQIELRTLEGDLCREEWEEKASRHSVCGYRTSFFPGAPGTDRLPGSTLTSNPNRCLRVSVVDDGDGMDEETQAKIFEPFFTTRAPGHGAGLGLCVVHGIMRRHQGAISVRSQPGKGTTVHLYFPVLPAPAGGPTLSSL